MTPSGPSYDPASRTLSIWLAMIARTFVAADQVDRRVDARGHAGFAHPCADPVDCGAMCRGQVAAIEPGWAVRIGRFAQFVAPRDSACAA